MWPTPAASLKTALDWEIVSAADVKKNVAERNLADEAAAYVRERIGVPKPKLDEHGQREAVLESVEAYAEGLTEETGGAFAGP